MGESVNAKSKKAQMVTKFIAPAIIVVVFVAASIIGTTIYYNSTHTSSNAAIEPKAILEEFEISALEYQYQVIVGQTQEDKRNFLFWELDPAFKGYAFQYDGSMQIGIDGKQISIDKEFFEKDGKTSIVITLPRAKILSHEIMVGNSGEALYDFSANTEKFTATEALERQRIVKAELETKVSEDTALMERAERSAKKQLQCLLDAIPGFTDNYTLSIVGDGYLLN
jgi:hypothetical protein